MSVLIQSRWCRICAIMLRIGFLLNFLLSSTCSVFFSRKAFSQCAIIRRTTTNFHQSKAENNVSSWTLFMSRRWYGKQTCPLANNRKKNKLRRRKRVTYSWLHCLRILGRKYSRVLVTNSVISSSQWCIYVRFYAIN